MTGASITVDGLAEFESTAGRAADELQKLAETHRTAGEVILQRPQPRTPAVASGLSYDVDDGVTTVTGEVIYAGHNGEVLAADQVDQIAEAFRDEVTQIVNTIHGT